MAEEFRVWLFRGSCLLSCKAIFPSVKALVWVSRGLGSSLVSCYLAMWHVFLPSGTRISHLSNKEHRFPSRSTKQRTVLKKETTGTSLVAQWFRIRLPMQGTWVRALVREDPTCRGATKPVSHSYWACALEPASHNYWACMPQLQEPVCLESVLCNKRSHRNEKPAHCNEE